MDPRRIYDVTIPIREGMVVWPGDDPVRIRRVKSMADGDRVNQSRIEMSAHSGTHIDAPVHFIDGTRGVDSISPSLLVGPVIVVEITGRKKIDAASLEETRIPDGVSRVILKTDNVDLVGKDHFEEDFAYLTADGAKYLVSHGIKLLGVDYYSVAEFGKGDEVHRILLSEGIVVIEGLDLRGVPVGMYRLMALPLKIAGGDGAPARVLLHSS